MDSTHEEKRRQTATMATCLRYPGKVVIVTGGTSGIGLAIVTEFVRQGAKVVFCSRQCGAEKGQAIQRELQMSGCPGEAFYQVCDMCKESDIKRLILATVECYGCLDCLVNNVGLGYFEAIEDFCAKDFHNLVDVNILSGLLATKYALPYLRETKGNIINMGSILGVFGGHSSLSYAATKGAVIAMTKALAVDESEYGVRVNSISPGCTWTPLMDRVLHQLADPELEAEKFRDYQLLGRYGTPKEIVSAVLYLAADGTFCTGLNLVVSGGAEVGFGKKKGVAAELAPCACAGVKSQGSSSKE